MILKEIGRGVHGKVKLVKDVDTGEEWAIKVVEKHARRRLRLSMSHRQQENEGAATANPHLEKIRREIAILKKCNHPHVVRIKEVIDDPAAEKIYLVLEYLPGGDIKWHDDSDPPRPVMTPFEARRIFRDIICGVEYLHYQGIVHRDIKPANLLWTADARIKISDFGVSVFLGPESESGSHTPRVAGTLSKNDIELAKTAGSPAFFAPELCGHSALSIGKAIDVWAMGVTLYCMVFGQVPFIAETEFELFQVICKSPLEFPEGIAVHPQLIDLFVRLLEKDPLKRITLPEIKLHPWVTADMSIAERDRWLRETDPSVQFGAPMTVTEEELRAAVNLVAIIRNSFRKISSSFQNLAMNLKGGRRRRTKSMPSVPGK
ncbi:kinase-like domain-containing protein [Cladochytrium replicatum]|nr:kinase-like domain-containing protein [Cladochytrium replicatum]